jgi:hypothetical protein
MMRKTYLKMSRLLMSLISALLITFSACEETPGIENDPEKNLPDISGYPIVGTNQTTFFNNSTKISAPSEGEDFYGQNAHYAGNVPQYVDNGDGTVTDMVTGLMWQNSFDHNGDGSVDYDDKLSYDEILDIPASVSTGRYTDWRLPTIKEMQSRSIRSFGSS